MNDETKAIDEMAYKHIMELENKLANEQQKVLCLAAMVEQINAQLQSICGDINQTMKANK